MNDSVHLFAHKIQNQGAGANSHRRRRRHYHRGRCHHRQNNKRLWYGELGNNQFLLALKNPTLHM